MIRYTCILVAVNYFLSKEITRVSVRYFCSPVIDLQDCGGVDLLDDSMSGYIVYAVLPETPVFNCIAIWTAGVHGKYGIRVVCTVNYMTKCLKYLQFSIIFLCIIFCKWKKPNILFQSLLHSLRKFHKHQLMDFYWF